MDSDDREIRIGVVSHQIGTKAATIRQRHLDRTGLMHDVAVGQNEAIWRENKPRAAAVCLLRATCIGGLRSLQPLPNIDIDHRRADFLGRADDSLRVGVKELNIRLASRLRALRLRGFPPLGWY